MKNAVYVTLILLFHGAILLLPNQPDRFERSCPKPRVFEIYINVDGDLVKEKGDYPLPGVLEKCDVVRITIKGSGDLGAWQKYRFRCEITEDERKAAPPPPVYKGLNINMFVIDIIKGICKVTNDVSFELKVLKYGTVYKIKIIKYLDMNYSLRKDGVEIYSMTCNSIRKYNLGLQVGICAPLWQTRSYEINYLNPHDAQRSIISHDTWEPRLLIFASIYPFGIYPEKKGHPGGLQLNIGTEISESVFEKIYLGAGYMFKYLSLNCFINTKFNQVLPKGYITGDVVNSDLKTIPFENKLRFNFYFVIGLPFDFALNWMGKVLGIK